MLMRTQKDLSKAILSHIELTCLQRLADGATLDMIAEALGLSELTIDRVLTSATEKLNAQSRYHALAEAIRLGLVKL